MLLIVDAPHFYAAALWRKKLGTTGDWIGEWECYRAAPIIGWMKGKDGQSVRDYLHEKKWRYQWRM